MNILRKFQYDSTYMQIAKQMASLSYAKRKKVGAIIVSKNGQLISQGFNGTPTGRDNCCEYIDDNGNLITKDEVLHAESNALSKCVRFGGASSDQATIYVTLSPCINCAKQIIQAGIKRVVCQEIYKTIDGIKLLIELGVEVDLLLNDPDTLVRLGWDYDKNEVTRSYVPIDNLTLSKYRLALQGSDEHIKYKSLVRTYGCDLPLSWN